MVESRLESAKIFGAGLPSAKTGVLLRAVLVIVNDRPSRVPWNEMPFLLVMVTLFAPWKSAPYVVVAVIEPDWVDDTWYFRIGVPALLTVVLLCAAFVSGSKIS
ncbi:MAG: hypothetical protein JOY54_00355 [Acidobacteriaceae bacterium]|nr:hypothetical protein [Acidobacteriaceae bacterium]